MPSTVSDCDLIVVLSYVEWVSQLHTSSTIICILHSSSLSLIKFSYWFLVDIFICLFGLKIRETVNCHLVRKQMSRIKIPLKQISGTFLNSSTIDALGQEEVILYIIKFLAALLAVGYSSDIHSITSCTVLQTSIHSSLGTLSDRIYLSLPLYNHKWLDLGHTRYITVVDFWFNSVEVKEHTLYDINLWKVIETFLWPSI